MKTSDSIAGLAKALAAAQADIKPAIRDSKNPFFKSTYADLASVFDACRLALAKVGVVVVQGASAEGTRVTVTSRLIHESGEWVESELSALAKDEGPQAVGSTITYLRRYSLAALAGVATEDDDGEGGQGRGSEPRKRGMEGVRQALNGSPQGQAAAALHKTPEPVDDEAQVQTYLEDLHLCKDSAAVDALVMQWGEEFRRMSRQVLARCKHATEERRSLLAGVPS